MLGMYASNDVRVELLKRSLGAEAQVMVIKVGLYHRIASKGLAVFARWLFIATAAAGILAAQDDRARRVDEIFQSWNQPATPGAAVAIIQDGKLLYQKGYGVANLEYDVPITPETVFHVASVSK